MTDQARLYPFQVLLRTAGTGLGRDSRHMPSRSDRSPSSVGDQVGFVPKALMLDIDDAMRLHLGL